MSWEDQGRQDHGWFGHGMGGLKTEADSLFEASNLDQRIEAVAHGVLMHVPRKEWHRSVLSFDRENLDRIRTAMSTWINARALSNAAFGSKLTDPLTSDAAIKAFRAAARGTQTAQSHEDLRDASSQLAAGMQSVGLGRWPSFLRDAAERAETYQRGNKPIMLAQASSNTRTDASAAGASATTRPADTAATANAAEAARESSDPAIAPPANAPAQASPPKQPQAVTADQLRTIMPNAGDAADRYVGALNQAMVARVKTRPDA